MPPRTAAACRRAPPFSAASARARVPVPSAAGPQLIGTPSATPDANELWFVRNEKARKFVCGLPRYEPVPLCGVFPHAVADGLDLLSHMIQVTSW